MPARRSAAAPLRARQEERIAALYDRTAALAYGLLLRLLGDARRAEAAMLEIYRDAAEVVPGLEDEQAARWILNEARRLALRTTRREPSRSQAALELPRSPAALEPQERAVRNDAEAVLAALPSVDRRVLELAYFGGLTPRAIAGHLGLAEDTVKARLRAALQGLSHVRPSTTTSQKEAAS